MILRRWLASVRTRLRGAAAEHELDDELRTHLEMAAEEYLARGMSEREARRAAHRDLGGVTAVKEARRQADSLYWLDTLTQDLRYGVRILRRSPRFTVAVVLILGVGVGMTTAVFAIVDSVLLNAVPFGEAHRLVELHRFGPTGGGPSQPAAMVESWRNERALFDGVEAYVRVERVFTGGDEPETMQGARISPGLLPLLGVAPQLGRAFAPDEAANAVAIVSYSTWLTRFGGDADIVGRPLRFSDGVLTIVGVMPASFRFPDAHTVFWEPLDVGSPGRLRRSGRASGLGPRPTRAGRDVRAGRCPGGGAGSPVEPRVVLDRVHNPAQVAEPTRGSRRRWPVRMGSAAAGRAVPAVRAGRLRAAHRVRQRREPVPVAGVVPHAGVRDPGRRGGEPAAAVPSAPDRVGARLRLRWAAGAGVRGVAGRACRRRGAARVRPGGAEPHRRGWPGGVLGRGGGAARRRRGDPATGAAHDRPGSHAADAGARVVPRQGPRPPPGRARGGAECPGRGAADRHASDGTLVVDAARRRRRLDGRERRGAGASVGRGPL